MSVLTKIMVYPEYISFKDFADRFCEEYIEAHLPIVQDENKWVEWGLAVAGNEAFLPYNIPAPAQIANPGKIVPGFKTWQDWAKAMYIALTNNLNTN